MDVQTTPGSMNTSTSHPPPDASPNFIPIVRSPHVVVPLSSDPSAHLVHDISSVFPNQGELTDSLPNCMHVSIPPSATMNTMDIRRVSPSKLALTQTLIPNFQPPRDSFGNGILPHMDGNIEMDSPSDSHIPPPPVHPLPPAYTVGTSSLASALDTMAASMGVQGRSRAGSSASPGSHVASGFQSVNGVLTSVDSGGVHFPPSNAPNGNGGVDNPPSGQPLMAVGDVLGSIAQTANSAREACSLGQSAEANVKIDELKRAISWVSEAIAKIESLSLTESSPPLGITSAIFTKHSPQAVSALIGGNPVANNPHAMHGQNNLDGLDVSRKRCASSMAESGDRVIKAPKMEPQEDPKLTIAASPTKPLPTHIFPPPSSSLSSTIANRSLPSSTTPSRQPSPPVMPMNLLQQPLSAAVSFTNALPPGPPIDFGLSSSVPPHSAPPFPLGARNRSSWSDTPVTLPNRHHQHSLSGTSLSAAVNFHGLAVGPPPSSSLPFTAPGTFGSPSTSPPKQRPIANGNTSISPPQNRIARSGSITSPVNPLSYGFAEVPPMDPFEFSRPSTSIPASQSQRTSPESEEDDETEDDTGDMQWRCGNNQSSPDIGSSNIHGNEVPQEYRAEVDRIFFEFLNKTCSNLDAADSKGEPIHQTLMAKKMQRLDESPDFRPFKFRIAAFTNAFLEELARQGYPEEKIPMKKIRNYLWKQVYIQRFNEDGKKAKSKGNHIWNIDAKKGRDGGWVFRPFHRRLAGSPPGISYVGLRWSWTPRIWDPQAASSHIPVQYSSPSLPSWLSWKEDVLSGIPPPDAESCDIVTEATYMRDGQEERLSHTFHLTVAPISALDTSFSSLRRPSIAGLHNPRRVQSDTQVPSQSSLRTPINAGQPSATSQGAQVMQVLTSAAQRVAQEAQSQVIAPRAANESSGHELQALAKQQHVLTMTAAAYDKEYTEGSPSSVLAAAARQVVLHAAANVAAGRSPPSQTVAPQQVTVNEVSVATQTAVAQAVEITGPLSSEVDVLMTATSLLQQQTRVPEPSQLPPSMDTSGGLPSRPFPGSGGSGPFPSSRLTGI